MRRMFPASLRSSFWRDTTPNGQRPMQSVRLRLERLENRLALSAYALSTLASFDGSGSANPFAGVIMDSSGNLYGTTLGGGTDGYGTVFELAKGSNTITTLASFDGTDSAAGFLVMDSSGNLYGTMEYGGIVEEGTVFELAKGSNTITTLASFDDTDSDPEGAYPHGSLIMDSNGDLYGTTEDGGYDGYGTVFELAKGSDTIATLASFDGSGGTRPAAGLVMDSNGDLYGTTEYGYGDGDGAGTVFELANGSNTIATLAGFDGSNGVAPRAGLIMDSSGNLFGTTAGGGTDGYGTVFELAKGSNTITALASFDGSGGEQPEAGLIMDSSGDLYGTTAYSAGRANDNPPSIGTVFEVAKGSGTITTLASINGTDGYYWPGGSLIMDSSGNLYGTAMDGGVDEAGTVFELVKGSSTDEWTGANFAVDTNWSDGANWSLGVPPTSGQTALFTNDSSVKSFTATVDAGFTNAIAGLDIDSAWEGTISVQAPLTVAGNFTMASGTFGGPGSVSVAGTASQWNAGQIDVGAGGFTNTGTLTADTTSGNLTVSGNGTLTNQGTINEAGTSSIVLGSGAKLANASGATFDLTDDGNVSQSGGGTLTNAGTLEKTGGTGTSTLSSSLINSGAISVQTGTLALASGATFQWTGGTIDVSGGGLTNTGTINADTSAGNLVLTGAGTFTNNSTLSVAGTNSLLIENGATLTNASGGTLDLTGDGNVGQSSGGTLTNAGTLEKTGGTATSTISSSFVNSNAITVEKGILVLASAGGVSTGGTFNVGKGATLDLTGGTTVSYTGSYKGTGTGTVALQGGTFQVAAGGATFNMAGRLFQWTGGTIDVTSGAFTNTGTVNFSSFSNGNVAINGPGSFINEKSFVQTSIGALTLENHATLNNAKGSSYTMVVPGAVAQYDGGSFLNAGTLKVQYSLGPATISTDTFSNTGTVQVSGALVIDASVPQISGSTLTAGKWTVAGSLFPATLQIASNGGITTIAGSANVSLSGLAGFSNLNVLNAVAKGGTLSLSGNATFTTAGGLSNLGTVALASGTLNISGAVAQLPAGSLTGGTWTVGANSHLNFPAGSAITALAGAMVTLNGTNSNFAALADLATVGSTSSFSLLGGRSFTAVGSFTNSGKLTIGPGSVLTANGSFTQSSTGTPTDELAGTTGAPTFGSVLSTTGTVTLGGKLSVSSTVIPAVDSYFEILGNEGSAAVAGTFTGLAEGGTFSVKRGGTNMTFKISYVGGDGNDIVITRVS